MEVVEIRHVLNHEVGIQSTVTVQGWVRSIRSSKGGFSFLSIHDGSSFNHVQAVADESLPNYHEIQSLTTGSAVCVSGVVVESSGRGQDREIQASEVQVVGLVEDPEEYPIAKKRHSFEYLRTVAHLRPRTNTFGAIARLRHATATAIHEYFNTRGFVWISTPIITASDCEGAGDLFRVSTLDIANSKRTNYDEDFFGKETFLAVSGQLNVEAYCLALSKVYTFGPTFRAENSNTSRHLAEFWMVEPEIAFADLQDNADLAQDFLKCVFESVLDAVPDDIEFFNERIDNTVKERIQTVIDKPFVQMDYSDAIANLQNSKKEFEYPVEWGLDLQTEHERYLTEAADAPVVVCNYPAKIKAFYMRLNDDEKTVAAMDVLVPGVGEIIGGSQREERTDVLDSRMDDAMREELWWYRELRKYGSVPHAGFGVGFERLVLYMSGMENIRDIAPFPRVPNNASF
ncbi:MAG: asparagine--tRNA ligase [Gammaproteobacteria bacterium]|nr:asparagine--tRNA ligase [Gammaproteobacteria bacterium]